ncbi:hypothetical protein ABE236_18305 [Priestia endophytica]|uniref:hypothetical protein n=1 Tax=Priestia endophytica TaxID=135735 RepID=UPI003D28693A
MNLAYELEKAREENCDLRSDLDSKACQLSEAQESATDLYKIILQVKNLIKGGSPEIALKAIDEALEYEYEGVDMNA